MFWQFSTIGYVKKEQLVTEKEDRDTYRIGRAEHDLEVVTVTNLELIAKDDKLRVVDYVYLAERLNRANYDRAVLAEVDLARLHHVVNVELTCVAFLNEEFASGYRAWSFHKELALRTHESSLIKLILFFLRLLNRNWLLFRLRYRIIILFVLETELKRLISSSFFELSLLNRIHFTICTTARCAHFISSK